MIELATRPERLASHLHHQKFHDPYQSSGGDPPRVGLLRHSCQDLKNGLEGCVNAKTATRHVQVHLHVVFQKAQSLGVYGRSGLSSVPEEAGVVNMFTTSNSNRTLLLHVFQTCSS